MAPGRRRPDRPPRTASLRTRLAVATGVAVAVAVALASAGAYVVARTELVGQVDRALRERIVELNSQIPSVGGFPDQIPQPLFGGAGGYVQIVWANGTTQRPANELVPLPVTAQALAVAAGHGSAFFATARVSGLRLRIYTVPSASGNFALQIARPLSEVDAALARLRGILLLITVAGAAAAAGVGTVVARTGLRPVRRLTETVERVTATHDLTQRIEVDRQDEVGRLATRFNEMLDALQAAERAQRQLVADASHELRTPLTSVRTNVEVLAVGDRLSPTDRERLLADTVNELEEFSALVGDLVDLARGSAEQGEPEDVALHDLVAHAVERARRHAPGMRFEVTLAPSIVRGVPARLDRAIANLLDNAVKWSSGDGPIEVALREGVLTVRDHGPGIDPKDLPFVFDRFYRAADSRGLPGSGLGLAIVRQIAEASGGSVAAEPAEGGGTRFLLRL